MQRQAMVYDIERGKAQGILPQPWQTDTCIGSWHYDQAIFEHHRYKTAASVIRMLADIVSKNGNLMLSVPLQRDGQPDADEIKIVSEIGAWLKVNGDAIYATRPWKIYGEGPSTEAAEKGQFDGQTRRVRTSHSRPKTSASRNPRTAKRFTPSCWRFRRTAKSPSSRSPAIRRTGRAKSAACGWSGWRQVEIHPRRKRPARYAARKIRTARLRSRLKIQS